MTDINTSTDPFNTYAPRAMVGGSLAMILTYIVSGNPDIALGTGIGTGLVIISPAIWKTFTNPYAPISLPPTKTEDAPVDPDVLLAEFSDPEP